MPSSSLSYCSQPKSHAVPYAEEMICAAQQGRSFQTRELLQRIVSGEQQRIREEQMLWRLGGALLGACLGLGDGFQAADIFLGMGMAGLAGLSHEVMSHEQRQFLESCHSLWTIGSNSPVELMARLGPARSRILLYGAGWDSPVILSHHQGARGDVLVPLGLAGHQARGFHASQSFEVMQRHFSSDELELLQQQFYPDAGAASQLRRLQPISASQARQLDPHSEVFLLNTEPVLLENADGQAVGYRVPIPVHSDF
jgi:hypothetical protein